MSPMLKSKARETLTASRKKAGPQILQMAATRQTVDIDTSGPKVLIKLSKENFDFYIVWKHEAAYRSVLNSSIVLPALVSVIEQVRSAGAEGREAVSELRWFIMVSRRLRDQGIDVEKAETFVDSSLKVAHALLGDPLTSALNGLKSITDNDE